MIGILAMQRDSIWLKSAGWLLFVGILLFCGSFYLLALTGNRSLGLGTPFGGVAFMLGWLALAIGALRQNR